MQNYRDGDAHGHRTGWKPEPTKSLTTLLGLGQESRWLTGRGGFFFRSDICFLLSTLWLLYALYHCPRGALSRIGRILIISPPPPPPHVSLSLLPFSTCRDLCEFSLAARETRSFIDRVIYFRTGSLV